MHMKRTLLLAFSLAFIPMASPLSAQAQPQPKVTALKAAWLWDGTSETRVPDAVVVIEGDRITAAGSRVPIPKGARIIDLGPATILPGLIDAHTHLLLNEDARQSESGMDIVAPVMMTGTTKRALRGVSLGREYLEAGFTAVRDVGNGGQGGDLALRDAIREGWVEGPVMLASGRAISGPRGQYQCLPEEHRGLVAQEYAPILDAASALRAVRLAVAEKADHIKVILDPTFSQDDLAAIVAEAHRLKRKVAAHATSEYEVLLAAECKVDSIEHGTQGVPAEALGLMAKNHICFVPTVTSRLLAQRLYVDALGLPAEQAKQNEAEAEKWLASMRGVILAARDAGVPIVLGSDLYHQLPGLTRGQGAREVLFGLVEAGLRPLEALRAATVTAAELMGRGDTLGRVKGGYSANLLAVEGNPLEDIHALARIKLVVVQGRMKPLSRD
jgi:imidazolonepropionase-like amidohydrolase